MTVTHEQGAKPNYTSIAKHLTEAVTSGHFAVGALLPTELELSKHYGTSRHTIRVALSELERVGLVLRKKNVGTRVIAAAPKARFRPTLASVDDLVQFGVENLRSIQRVDEVRASADLAREIGCEEDALWLRISSLRLVAGAEGEPLGWTDVYVSPEYAEMPALMSESPGTLASNLLEQRYGQQIDEIEQDVRAFILGHVEMARALNTPLQSAALKIVRRYLGVQGETLLATVTVHPADRFSVSMRLKR